MEAAWGGVEEIRAGVERGELEPGAVAASHLERIARIDPRLHAYVHVDRGCQTGIDGELAGVTMAVKDTQPVAGMPWTLGSARWRDRIAAVDGLHIASLRRAGVAILGKTNTPELAGAVGTTNQLFGATENPWRPGYTPGGSSGGSAAAVAAGLATFATGDDVGGSIRIPASCCGVVGLRPTPGRVADEEFDPVQLNSRGPIARSVADVRRALSVMLGEAAPASRGGRRRIGVVLASPMEVEPAGREACLRAAEALAAAGHEVGETAWDPEPVAEGYRVVRRFSLARFPGRPSEYGPGVRELIEQGRRLAASELYDAHRLAAGAAQTTLVDPLRELDAILTPTLGLAPMPISEVPGFLGQAWKRYTQFVLPVSFARLPAVSLPAGLAGGLPVGVQLVGRFREEWALLDLAAELESGSTFGFLQPPGLG